MGLRHRRELFEEAARRLPLAGTPDSQVELACNEFCSQAKRYGRRLNPKKPHGLHASRFVRNELGVLWGWLAYELLDSFFRHVHARAFGQVIIRQFQVVFDPPAPPMDVAFKTLPGETLSQATTRLMQAFLDARHQLTAEAQRHLRGRRPKGDAEHLGRYARWFYRNRVKQPPESVRHLAREYATQRLTTARAAAKADYRGMVQHGIKEAERLLGQVGQYELKTSSSLPN